MRDWFAKNILGLVRAPEAKMIDIRKELGNGKSILLDSSVNSPMHDVLSKLGTWPEYIEEPTVELWTWGSPVSSYSEYPSKGFFSNPDGTLTGQNLAFITNQHGSGRVSFGGKLFRISTRQQIENTKISIRGGKKTIVHFNRHKILNVKQEIERVFEAVVEVAEELWQMDRKQPVYMVQLLATDENEYIHDLIRRLQDIAPSVVIRLVDRAVPTAPLTADIHIVERPEFKKYLRSEAEVLLANNQRAMIATHHQAREFTKWDYKNYKFEDTPTVAEYNASFNSKSTRKAFTDKHRARWQN